MGMKIKKSKNKKKYADGGDQSWNNLMQVQPPQNQGISESKNKSSINASQIGGYAGAAASALSPLWEGSKYYKAPENNTTHQVFSGIKGVASNIPVAGAFIQAGSMLGQGFDTGANKALSNIANNKGNKTTNEAGAGAMHFFKGMSDPISNYETIDKLRKMGKLSTGQAVGYGLTHLFGGPGVSEAVLQKKFRKELHPEFNKTSVITPQNPVDQLNSENGLMMQGNNFAHGGSLEHYNLPKHSELPNDFANAQMDGTGVQLEKNETMLKFPDGGNKSNKDYAFSPNLGFDKFGKPTINEKDVKVTFADASKKIEKTKTYGYDKANANSLKFKFENLKNIAEATREAKEGIQPFSNGGVNKYSNSGFNRYNIVPLKKGNIQLPEVKGMLNYKEELETPRINSYDFYDPQTGNLKNNINHNLNKNNKQGLNLGDSLQLAGSAVAPLANLAMYLANKSEKVKAHLDNTKYSDPRIAKDYNPLYLAENAARKSIDDSSTSDSIRRANLVQLASNTGANAQDYSLKVDNTNKSLMMQRDNMLSGTNRFNAQARAQRDDLQAQNDARRRAFLTTGASQLGQGLVEGGKASNANDLNTVYGNILKSYSPDFYMDNKGNLVFKKKAKGGYLKKKK